MDDNSSGFPINSLLSSALGPAGALKQLVYQARSWAAGRPNR